MSNLAHVVQQLRKERNHAFRTMKQLDEALKALSGVGAGATTAGHTVLKRHAGNQEPCQRQRAEESLQPSAGGGRNGRRPDAASKPIRAAFSTIPFTDISFSW